MMRNGLDDGPSVFQFAIVCVHAHAHVCAFKCCVLMCGACVCARTWKLDVSQASSCMILQPAL